VELSQTLADLFMGPYYVAGTLLLAGVIVAIWQMRTSAEADKRAITSENARREQEAADKSIALAEQLRGPIDDLARRGIAEASSPDSDILCDLLRCPDDRGWRLPSLNLAEILKDRGLLEGDTRSLFEQEQAKESTHFRLANMADVFAAKAMHGVSDPDIAFRYCANDYCRLVETWAPFIAYYLREDAQFFQDGWILYRDWAKRLDTPTQG
jgi:hypothetical protein